jgi:hypothetical protein
VIPVSIVNDTSNENHTGCNAVISALLELCELNGLDVIERLTRRQILEGQTPTKCAQVIINGEGSLHHNGSQARFFPRLLEMLDQNEQPAVLINTVWDTPEFMGERWDWAGNWNWARLHKWVRLISFRESMSYDQLQKDWDGQDSRRPEIPVMITPDLSFWQLTKADFPYCPREDRWTGYSDSLPPVTHKRLDGHPDSKQLALRPAREPDVLISLLRKCKEYHTARFHGACFALMAGVPEIVPYPANTHKIRGLMEDVRRWGGRQPYVAGTVERISNMMRQVAAIASEDARATQGGAA